MTTRTRFAFLAGATLLVAGSSCWGDATGPGGDGGGQGMVEVTLSGARADDRALLFEVGDSSVSVAAVGTDVEVYAIEVNGTRVVAVLGTLGVGAVARVSVTNVDSLPTFKLRDVAAEDGTLRADLSGYALVVAKPEG